MREETRYMKKVLSKEFEQAKKENDIEKMEKLRKQYQDFLKENRKHLTIERKEKSKTENEKLLKECFSNM